MLVDPCWTRPIEVLKEAQAACQEMTQANGCADATGRRLDRSGTGIRVSEVDVRRGSQAQRRQSVRSPRRSDRC